MSDAPTEKKYDTNPLDKRVAERAEAEMGSGEAVDTEGPTRPIPLDADPSGWADTDPTRFNNGTSPNLIGTGPIPQQPQPQLGAPTRGAYTPPAAFRPPQQFGAPPQGWDQQPPPGPMMQPPFAPGNPRRGVAQLGLQANFAAMLCYLPFIGLVGSIYVGQNEPQEHRFMHFHAKQSLYGHIAFWAVNIAIHIARAAAPTPISIMLLLPQLACYLAYLIGFVFMMTKAYKGDWTKIPVIGDQVR
jgi:uncharacterized membrane protein